MRANQIEKYAIALHESAHAVVGFVYGSQVEKLSIRSQAKLGGGCWTSPNEGREREQVIVSYAGYWQGRLYGPHRGYRLDNWMIAEGWHRTVYVGCVDGVAIDRAPASDQESRLVVVSGKDISAAAVD
jgi:Peptidase M50B-like